MISKNKIVHIITRFDKGGSAENTLLTIMGMDFKKNEVLLFKGPTWESKMSRDEHFSVIADLKRAQSMGIKIVTIPFLFRRINPVYDFLALANLLILLLRAKPNIVHTHTSKAGFLGRLAAKLARIPIIIHTPHGHVFFGYFNALKNTIFVYLEKLTARITDKIIALTEGEKNDYKSYKIASEDKIVAINSGVDLGKIRELPLRERGKFKGELGIPEKSLVIGTAGRLEAVKGPEYLLEAAKDIVFKYPQTFFVFSGDGILRRKLEKKALDLNIKNNTIFLGWRNDIAQVISVYDIFVLPSLNEGMGRVLVEAMALGKPVVASNVGGIPDLVIHGKTGFLVPPKDPRRLAQYLHILLEDEEKRKSMGDVGKKAAASFSKEVMVKRIATLYNELLIKKNICSYVLQSCDSLRG